MGSFFDWVIGKSVAKYNGRIVGAKLGLDGLNVSSLSAASVIMTADQVLGGLIIYDPGGAATIATYPTAALLVAALGDAAVVGTSFKFAIRHSGSTSEVVTLTAGDGNTLSPATQALDGDEIITQLVRIDNITEDSESVTYYGTGLHLMTT